MRIVAAQAGDAEAHVLEPAGGIDARAEAEGQIGRGQFGRAPLRHLDQGRNACARRTSANPLQAGGDEHAIVVVERNQVGDGAERDQIEQSRQIRFAAACVAAVTAQLGA